MKQLLLNNGLLSFDHLRNLGASHTANGETPKDKKVRYSAIVAKTPKRATKVFLLLRCFPFDFNDLLVLTGTLRCFFDQ